MSIQRWDPFSDAMNRLFEDSFVTPAFPMQESRMGRMAVPIDLRERDDDYILEAALPGYKSEEIDVSVVGNHVSIQGEHKEEQEREQERYHLRERRTGRFQRIIALPSNVQSDKANCEFKDGVLTLTLPKAEEAKPRRIPISGGKQQIEASARQSKGQAQQESGQDKEAKH